MPFNVRHEKEYLRLTSTDFNQHPSVLNSIYRASTTCVDIYCFDEFLDQNDYEFLREAMGIDRLFAGHQSYTTVKSNGRFPVNKISHAISMTSLWNSDETLPYLQETDLRKIYFIIGEVDPSTLKPKPFKNTNSYPVTLHSHDFIPMVYTRSDDESEWLYNQEESDDVKANMAAIFPYNEMQVAVEYNKYIMVVVKPMLCNGMDHPRGIPCINRYQWIMDPALVRMGYNIINEDFSLRRKIEGEYSAKELFLLDRNNPIHGKPGKFDFWDKFGTPYGVEVLFIENGKMSSVDTLEHAIAALQAGLDLFETELTLGKASEIMAQEDNTINEQVLIVPKVADRDFLSLDGGKYRLLIDDSILHMLSVVIMQMVDKVIGDDLEKWTHVSIYYKVPHRLVPGAELHVKLPDDDTFTDKLRETYNLLGDHSDMVNDLIRKSITQCHGQLNTILNAVQNVNSVQSN